MGIKERYSDKSRDEIQAVIFNRIHSDVDRQIMRSLLLDGHTYESIAAEIDRSPRYVYYHVKNSDRKISKFIN